MFNFFSNVLHYNLCDLLRLDSFKKSGHFWLVKKNFYVFTSVQLLRMLITSLMMETCSLKYS